MTKLEKFLEKLAPKEHAVIAKLLERIVALDLNGLDVKKLKGIEHMYRVRKGDIRVIFSIEGKLATIIDINRKNDTTYNF